MGGETDWYGGTDWYYVWCSTLVVLQSMIMIYHIGNNHFHSPNKDKTWRIKNREATITATQASAAMSQSRGQGTGSTQQQVCAGRMFQFTLTPNNTSTAYMVLAMGTLIANFMYVSEPFTDDCETVLTFHYWCNIFSRIPQYMFVMLRVRVAQDDFSPLQQKIVIFLWWWFILGFLGVAIAVIPVSISVRVVDEFGNIICSDRGTPSDIYWPNFMIVLVYGFVDTVTQVTALLLFVKPMYRYIKLAKAQGQDLSDSAQKVLVLVQRIAFWTVVMLVSSTAAAIFYLFTGKSMLYFADCVINSYCLTMQYLRRHNSILSWFLSGCSAGEDGDMKDINDGDYSMRPASSRPEASAAAPSTMEP